MTDELVHLDIEGPRATITLDSQHNRNALSRQLVAELFAALEAAEAEPEVRVVLVRAGGIGLVAAADVVIADEQATFALTEVKLGLAAAIISLTVHARMNPRAAALTTLGGEVFGGRDAAAYGLVTEAVPGASLDARVEEVCGQLATGAPQGLRASKVILNRDLVARIDAYGEEMAALSARLFASDEARAAMTAFLKRKN